MAPPVHQQLQSIFSCARPQFRVAWYFKKWSGTSFPASLLVGQPIGMNDRPYMQSPACTCVKLKQKYKKQIWKISPCRLYLSSLARWLTALLDVHLTPKKKNQHICMWNMIINILYSKQVNIILKCIFVTGAHWKYPVASSNLQALQ